MYYFVLLYNRWYFFFNVDTSYKTVQFSDLNKEEDTIRIYVYVIILYCTISLYWFWSKINFHIFWSKIFQKIHNCFGVPPAWIVYEDNIHHWITQHVTCWISLKKLRCLKNILIFFVNTYASHVITKKLISGI